MERKLLLILILLFLYVGGYAQQYRFSTPIIERTQETRELLNDFQIPLKSGVIVLDFEGLGSNDPINDFYNGGTSGLGNSGENFGVEFSENALGLNAGNFSGNPSGVTIMYFTSGTPYMNVPASFDTGLSFYYCSWADGVVEVYDDLDGGGTLLTSLAFPASKVDGPCDNWIPFSVPFDGTAKSIVFGGSADQTGFDDVTFGSITPGEPEAVPLSDLAFIMAAMLMIGFVFYRFYTRS